MTEMGSLDVPTLVARYEDAALQHRLAIDAGDHKQANRHHDVIAAVYRELRRRGRAAQQALLPLLRHAEPGVRGWAAAHAMEFSPTDGEPVLIELASAPRALGMSASMTLRLWREGKLVFP